MMRNKKQRESSNKWDKKQNNVFNTNQLYEVQKPAIQTESATLKIDIYGKIATNFQWA